MKPICTSSGAHWEPALCAAEKFGLRKCGFRGLRRAWTQTRGRCAHYEEDLDPTNPMNPAKRTDAKLRLRRFMCVGVELLKMEGFVTRGACRSEKERALLTSELPRRRLRAESATKGKSEAPTNEGCGSLEYPHLFRAHKYVTR